MPVAAALRELRALRTTDLPPNVARFVDRLSASLQAGKPLREPLVLIHGFTGTAALWDPIVPLLEPRHEVPSAFNRTYSGEVSADRTSALPLPRPTEQELVATDPDARCRRRCMPASNRNRRGNEGPLARSAEGAQSLGENPAGGASSR